MLPSEGSIIVNGKTICSKFLKKAFSFRSDLQAKVFIYLSPLHSENQSISASTSISTNCLVAAIDRQSTGLHSIISFIELLNRNVGDGMPEISDMHLRFFRKCFFTRR